MKILLAGQAFYQHNNGQAVFTINLAEGLAAAGQQVMVLAPSERWRPYRTETNGVIMQTVPTWPLKYNANITLFSDQIVRQAVAAFGPEIIHIQDHYFLSRTLLRQSRDLPIRRVGTNHFLPDNITDNLRVPKWCKSAVQKLLWRTMLSVYNQLDGVTTPTPTGVAILQGVGLRTPVRAISCGVDSWRFRPRPELNRLTLRRKYHLSCTKPILLFVGRVDHEKGLDTVIDAMALLPPANLQLVIAGTGSYLPALQSRCQEVGLAADAVVFTGFVPDADLPLLLNSVDAFIMPSHAELQSIATLEAMASGLPILAANARALPELVTPEQNGYLFAPQDAPDAAQTLAIFLANQNRWASMGAASRVKVGAHTQANTIQHYLAWYQAIPQRTAWTTPLRPAWRLP